MQHLLLFAKRPRLGAVKTRLVPPLDAGQALELYEAFLADQIRFLRSFADRSTIEICWDGPPDESARLPAGHEAIRWREQGAGDMGRRLRRVFERSRRDGAEATVVIGSDSPTLPEEHVSRAFAALAGGADAVVAPAEDGGYVLIGMGGPFCELFEGIPWSGPRVLETTLARARAADIDMTRLAPWYDVDDGAALPRLRHDLQDPRHTRRAPETSRLLKRWSREHPA